MAQQPERAWSNSNDGNDHWVEVLQLPPDDGTDVVEVEVQVGKPGTKPIRGTFKMFGLVSDLKAAFASLGPSLAQLVERRPKSGPYFATRIVNVPGKYPAVIRVAMSHEEKADGYEVHDQWIVYRFESNLDPEKPPTLHRYAGVVLSNKADADT